MYMYYSLNHGHFFHVLLFIKENHNYFLIIRKCGGKFIVIPSYLQISLDLLSQSTIKFRILPEYNCIINIVNEEQQLKHSFVESIIIFKPKFE